ncbi:hypothetical protein KEJ36_04205 [Candidatus Bathyarchaeota archaeon]|nr:hypothetical protein [Candidatus Bathyarchaeota archaeon]MBS7627995.1 hypothetical protein [Candidatus Bathyarchaeota archaeon]
MVVYTASEGKIQCPCGRIIEKAEDYKFIFLKKEMREIDILCPNDSCYLREIGFIKFDMVDGKPILKEAVFYPPFVTWNVSQLGPTAMDLMKAQLRDMVKKVVDWKKIEADMGKLA